MGRENRHNMIIMGVLIPVLAGLLAWLSVRMPLVTDWTREGRHSLSAASRQILDRMDGKIEITSYARGEPELRELIRNFVNRYQRYKPEISLEFVDPDTVPDETRNLGIEVDGELLLRYSGRIEHVRSDSEQEFSNALQRLLRESDHWLAFVEGHGERSPLETGNHDLSRFGRRLQDRGLNLQPFNLARFNTIPDNTTLLVIASPRSAYLPGEVRTIIDYLESGGNLLWLIEPGENNGLQDLAAYLDLKIPAGTIIDIAGQVIGIDDPTISLVTTQLYASHPVVDQFKLTTMFPMAAAIEVESTAAWQSSPVLTTASHTWLERGELKGNVAYDEGTDLLGPFNLAVGVERELQLESTSRHQRIIVVGDGDFLSNTYLDNSGNLDLGLRMVDWIISDENFIKIPARTVEDAELELTHTESIIIGFGFQYFLPFALLITGILIWWKRRNL